MLSKQLSNKIQGLLGYLETKLPNKSHFFNMEFSNYSDWNRNGQPHTWQLHEFTNDGNILLLCDTAHGFASACINGEFFIFSDILILENIILLNPISHARDKQTCVFMGVD